MQIQRSHRDILETWFRRVWNEGDTSAIDDMFRQDGRARGLGAQTLVGPEDFKGFHKLMNELVDRFHIEIDHCVSEGDWVSGLCSVTAKCPDTGRDVKMTGTVYAKVDDIGIVEGYNHFDFMGLYEQLGLLPEGSFEKCLCREKVA